MVKPSRNKLKIRTRYLVRTIMPVVTKVIEVIAAASLTASYGNFAERTLVDDLKQQILQDHVLVEKVQADSELLHKQLEDCRKHDRPDAALSDELVPGTAAAAQPAQDVDAVPAILRDCLYFLLFYVLIQLAEWIYRNGRSTTRVIAMRVNRKIRVWLASFDREG